MLHEQAMELRLEGHIEMRDLQFAYPSRPDKVVLNGLDFKMMPGQRVALVGASGAGKSTLTSLLFRFYDADGGEILIDHKPIQSYSLLALRSQMALVPQDVILFGGTIEENIRYGKPNATEAEVIRAAEQANALGFINGFPDGFKTIVGERGVQLSGGQRQRIAIARAILKDPKILILDEATSSLDAESELAVQTALDNLMVGRTSLIIAHRLSTIRKADLIVVLENGRAVEQGSHEVLMAKSNGVYRNLSNLQMLDVVEN
jgi:ABC-type multidrug transport system fused ATPase/permease subunit